VEIIDKEWTPKNVDFTAENTSVLFRVRYIGDEDSGLVDIASTGDMSFTHGDSGSEAADTTVNPGGDTPGTLDLYGGTLDAFATYKSIVDMINASANWEAWLEGALPDDAPYTTTTGHMTEPASAAVATGANGYAVLTDDSDSKYCVAGLTKNGPSTLIHAGDSGIEWTCHRVIGKSTFASGTSALYLYECDDLAGTSTLLKSFTAGATTVEVAYPAETTPATENHGHTIGKRLVAKLVNSAAMGTTRIAIHGKWRQVAPAAVKGKMNPEGIRS